MMREVRLFGVLKKFAPQGVVEIDLPSNCLVTDAKERIKEELRRYGGKRFDELLVDRAVLANEKKVLMLQEEVQNFGALALLPPVCGG